MRVGPFKLDRRIGQGGMATVWGGVHVHQGAAVAFKFLRPERDSIRGTLRFLDETRALARMSHPAIVRIFDAGLCSEEMAVFLKTVEPESPYFVMEAVGGGTLQQHHAADWGSTRALLLTLLDALAHAHARDVVHRDIKPSNILVDDHGVLRLTDFGISRLTRAKAVYDRVTGTPSYMAPEQIMAEAHREGPWTDLYAIGCLAYWLVGGAPPFEGDVAQVLAGHVDLPPPPLIPRFSVPSGFGPWCLSLLQKDPQSRFTRAADAAAALARLDNVETQGVPQSAAARRGTSELVETTVVFGHLTASATVPSGGATVGDVPPPPKNWRTKTTASRGQLVSTGPGMLQHRQPTFLGRNAERQALWGSLRQLWETSGQHAIGLVGPTGIGRRSLARWFARRAHETGSVHVLVFGPDTQASAVDQLIHWWHEVGGAAGATAFWAARGSLDDLAEWDIEQIERLTGGAELGGPTVSAIHGRWTERLSRDRVVLYLASGDEALEFFGAAGALAPARRLLVAPATDADAYDRQIRLDPLPDHEIEALVFDLLGLSTRSQRQLANRAEGNPGLATSIARLAAQNDLLVESGQGFDLAADAIDDMIEALENRWTIRTDELGRRSASALRCLRLMALAAASTTELEFAHLCRAMDLSPAGVLALLDDSGLVEIGAGGIVFVDPLARRAAQRSAPITDADHQLLFDVFSRLPTTPRRSVVCAYHGFCAGELAAGDVGTAASSLRASAHVRQAIQLLESVIQSTEPTSSERHRLALELAECALSRQEYDAVGEALDMIEGEETEDVHAMRLFLRMRRLEDVQDELLDVDPSHLSETACRLVAYTFMDMGLHDRARTTLLAMDAQYDPPGRLYAFARLHFFEKNQEETERWGVEAARRFEQVGRPDGALAARDLVATAKLMAGHHAEAIQFYRDNLRAAQRIGAATFVMRYNLGVCLLQAGEVTEEADVLLEQAVGEALQRGRTDVEHTGRCAQVWYAVLVSNDFLVDQRLARLGEHDLGPWLQTDSLEHLRAALSQASDRHAPTIAALVRDIETALQ